jgi:RHS repeat-associated protein
MKRFLTLIILCVSTCAVFAQTNTWTGATNDHWETGSNWSLGIAPTPCHDIAIPAISGRPSPKLYGNISISNLTFSGANLSTNNFNINYTSAGPACGASVDCGCTDCDLATIKDSSNPTVSETATGTSTANYVIENTHLTSDGTSVVQSITYLDGLGRPMQKVSREAGGFLLSSPGTVSDLIQPIEYDAYGRETKKYLAYAATGANGGLIGSAVSNQATYFSGLGKSGNAYTDIVYENSPLNRILSQKAPGSGIAQTFVYRGNASGDNVKKLTYNFGSNKIDIATYGAGELFVTEITDENGNKTIEYKDLEDRVICREVSQKKTYYCFDDFGLLRCVIPPKAAGVLSGSDFVPTTNDLLFLYSYDARGRMISKKIPGAGTTSMTYDSRDRLDVTTDAKSQAVKNIYDDLNRVTSVTLNGTEITHNYYDAYPAATGGASENFDQTHAYNVTKLADVKGMLAAVQNLNLGTTSAYRMVTYYDNTGQVIQTTSQNHKGSWSRSSSQLDFAGRVLGTKLSTINSLVVETRTSYDRGGRAKAVCQKVSDGSTDATSAYWEPVGRYSYNGIGEMVSKTLGCNIQKVDYAYNMRGWMRSLNDPNNLVTASEKDYFGMTLGYDGVGNITTWNYRSSQRTGAYGDAYAVAARDPFAYTFTYDNLNRIKTASLVKTTGSTTSSVFTLGGSNAGAIDYDDNGNILNMKRTFNGTGNTVDNLAYAMESANSNRVASITETGTNPTTANEFFGASTSYSYDSNGNLTKDTGKGISDITYNYLNLPQTITKSGQAISYNYTADGTKRKVNFGTGKVYDYVAGLVYVNDTLEFIPTAEGRILPPLRAINPQLNGSTASPAGITNTFYRYEYQINDHLGNLRIACRCGEKSGATTPSNAYAPIVVQENHYDPWGLGLPLNADAEKVAGSPEDRFKFIGRESQQSTGWIDLQARFYDPQIGRFLAVDPETEGQDEFSPYHYSFNNPIRFSDPDGKWPGGGLFKSIKNWFNTPLTQGQQNASRGLNISFSGQDYASKTRGEALLVSIGQGIRHGMSHGLPGNSKTTGLPKNVMNGPAGKSGKAANAVPEATPAVSNVAKAGGDASPNVKNVLDIISGIKNEGGQVQVNPLNTVDKQELNMTFKNSDGSKLDMRIETHELPSHLGGDGVTPQRHLNADVTNSNGNRVKMKHINGGHKILE